MQPIVVRETPGGANEFELISGERRLRATKSLGQKKISALVKKVSDQESLELSIIENAQRENLNPLEEAKAYKLLNSKFKLNQSEIAQVVGKNRATISNSLRLLQLPEDVQEFLLQGEISTGHAKVLLSVGDPEAQSYYAGVAVRQDLSVRGLESKISRDIDTYDEEDEEYQKLLEKVARQETRLANILEMEQVSLSLNNQGQKKLSLTFDSEAQWKRFVAKLK